MILPVGPHIEALILAIIADRLLTDEELALFEHVLASHPETSDLDAQAVAELIDRSQDRLAREGLDHRLSELRRAVPDPQLRDQILRDVLLSCLSDGFLSRDELDFFARLQAALTR